jgi:hypothetical protein
MDVSRNWWLLPASLGGCYQHSFHFNQFADLLAQAGLREKAPHHVSKEKAGALGEPRTVFPFIL